MDSDVDVDSWRNSGDRFEYLGFPVFYRKAGKKSSVLLCLHGFPTSSFDYRKVWNDLSARFTLLAPDLIGYGFSAKPIDLNYTTFAQADLIAELLEHLGVSRVHILAHDYGNTITQELLARDAEGRLNFAMSRSVFSTEHFFRRRTVRSQPKNCLSVRSGNILAG